MSSQSTTYVSSATRSVTPYLCVDDTRRAIAWYGDIFGAVQSADLILMDDGRVGHAEIRIGDSVIMLADEFPEIGVVSPKSQEGSSASFNVEVADVDDTFARAVAAGASGDRPPADEFYGARSGWITDPFGHRWSIQTPLPVATSGAGAAPSETASGAGGTSEAATASPAAEAARPVNELGYFTLTTPDVDRAAAFYGALLGWDAAPAELASDGTHHYRHVGNTSVPFGFHDDPGDPSPHHYYRVGDLDAMVRRVRDLGGEVLEVSQYESGGNARCRDDQGVEFELWQAAPGY
jgi:uncharacterized glyoxalase superfamily protein PhnB